MLAVRGRDNVNFATPNKEPIGGALPDLFSKAKSLQREKIRPVYLILHKPISWKFEEIVKTYFSSSF